MKTIIFGLITLSLFGVLVPAFAQEDDICGIAAAYYNDNIDCEKIPQHCAQSYFDIKANEERLSINSADYGSYQLLKSAEAGLENCMNPNENIQSEIPHECREEYRKIVAAKSGLASSDDMFYTQVMSENLKQYTIQYNQCFEDLESSKVIPVSEIICGEGTIDIDGMCQVEKQIEPQKKPKKSSSWFSIFWSWFS